MLSSIDNVNVFADIEAMAAAAADQFAVSAQRAVSIKGSFHLVLAGGGTTRPLYRRLSTRAYSSLPWNCTKFYWGDERIVPPDHKESNYKQAWELLISKVPVKSKNVFRIRGELNPDAAALEYQSLLKTQASSGRSWPRFDLVLLGMGEDGHTASIFPGSMGSEERQLPVISVKANYEDRPSDRVSMTPMLFNSAKSIIFLAAGAEKSKALKAALKGVYDPVTWPVHRIRPVDGTITWFVDLAAASSL